MASCTQNINMPSIAKSHEFASRVIAFRVECPILLMLIDDKTQRTKSKLQGQRRLRLEAFAGVAARTHVKSVQSWSAGE